MRQHFLTPLDGNERFRIEGIWEKIYLGDVMSCYVMAVNMKAGLGFDGVRERESESERLKIRECEGLDVFSL